MPRTLQEILDHADELADRFGAYEPDDRHRVGVDEIADRRLRQAAVATRPSRTSGRRRRQGGTCQRDLMATHRRITRHLSPGTQKRYAVLIGKAKANLARSRAAAVRARAARTKAARRAQEAR